MTDDVETWRRRGEAARLAHETVNAAFRAFVREREPDRYAALLQDFWEKTAAALPSTDPAFMPGLANGRGARVVPEAGKRVVPEARKRSLETAIAFLEADPWFFRSGYEKLKIIQHQARAAQRDATDAPRGKCRGVRSACGHDRRPRPAGGGQEKSGRDRVEFRHFGRLACGIWSAFLDEEVANRMQSPDPGIRRRATWVAEAAISAGKA